jgi:CRP/FNR family transcriptional regulator
MFFMDTQQLISQNPLFADLSAGELQEVKRFCHARTFGPDEIIFSEGEPADRLYCVAAGRARVYKLSADGREHVIHTFGPGDSLGEAAMFAGSSYPAYAGAIEESMVLSITRADLLALIKKNPSISLKMLAALSRRLRTMVSIIEDRSVHDVEGRLAKYIFKSVMKRNAAVFELDISKGALAQLLGTIPETLSRTLKKLEQKGLIGVDGKRITVRLRDKLLQLARGTA